MRATDDAAGAIDKKIHWEVFINFKSVRVQIYLLEVSAHVKLQKNNLSYST